MAPPLCRSVLYLCKMLPVSDVQELRFVLGIVMLVVIQCGCTLNLMTSGLRDQPTMWVLPCPFGALQPLQGPMYCVGLFCLDTCTSILMDCVWLRHMLKPAEPLRRPAV